MKRSLVTLLLAGAVALSGAPAWADGMLARVRLEGTNYCHLKFPAIVESTLAWDQPVLKDASSGDLIDFYGSCDHDPLGKEEIAIQRQQRLNPSADS